MALKYRLGNVVIGMSGEDPILELVAEELAPIATETDAACDIEFLWGSTGDRQGVSIEYSPMKAYDNGFWYSHGQLEYFLDLTRDTLTCHIKSVPAGEVGAIKTSYRRFRNWNYLTPLQNIAKNFAYNVFNYLVQLTQVKSAQSLIHASTFEKNGDGVAILAWGGIGKTTTLLKLLTDESDWKFLSDDLGLLNAEGQLFRTPLRMQVYGYNLIGQPEISAALMSGRSTIDKLSWKMHETLRGPKRVRRRVSPDELFGAERAGSSAKLRRAFLIERHSGDEFEEIEINHETAASLCSYVVLENVQPLAEVSNIYHALGRPGLIDAEAVRASSEKIIGQGLAHAKLTRIRIPHSAGPNELVGYLRPRMF